MRRSIVGSLITLSLVASACSAAATPAPTKAPTAASTAGTSGAPTTAVKTPIAFPAAETTNLKVALSNNLAVNQFINVLARDLGLFQKYGLTVEVISLAGGAGAVVQGLVSNSINIGVVSAGAALSASLTDAPLVTMGLDSTSLSYSLIGSKDVKSGADLKGKSVAISTLGDVSHAAVLATLQRLNLKPTDVLLQTIGNEAARISAVISGAVAAAPVQSVNSKKVLEQGTNLLIDLDTSPVKFGIAGVTATKAWAAKNQGTILRFLAAVIEAQQVMIEKPALAAVAYATFTSLDAATAKASIEACAKGVCNKGLVFSAADFALNKEVLATVNAAAANVDVNTVIDLGPLTKLKEMGFNAEINFP